MLVESSRPQPTRGILLLNLGTPDSPTIADVRRYLREFLSDPLVIDLPAPLRYALVRGVILPFRPKRSAIAYQRIWTERGSPLRYHGTDLARALQGLEQVPAVLGMRYGQPSIGTALDQLIAAGVQRVVIAPLFPQYSQSAWRTSVRVATEAATAHKLATSVLQPFYDQPRFLDVLADHTRQSLEAFDPDHLLLSFHGLPERHLRRTDHSPPGHRRCLVRPDCCERIESANRDCYRAHCFATARGLAARLTLEPTDFEVTFQSRLGRTPWIQPFTDHRIKALAASGCRRLAVACPSFVADCLETLEEIAISGREMFRAHGGEELLLVPALNSQPAWAQALSELLQPDMIDRE